MRKGINAARRMVAVECTGVEINKKDFGPGACSCALAWALGQHLPRPAQELEEPHPSHCFTFSKCFHSLTLAAQCQKPSTTGKKKTEEKKCWQADSPNEVGMTCPS